MNQTYQKRQHTIVGIDYSLNNPAICIVQNENFNFKDCSFHFLTSTKKNIGRIGVNTFGYEHKDYTNPIERFTNISSWTLDIIHRHRKDQATIYIEGYSFGSKGQAVFQIAENCGILKYRLLMSPFMLYETIVPSVVKKHATGKGNADKEKMYDQFYVDTGVNLMEKFEQKTLSNPVTDIVDSYYIAKVGYENSKSEEQD